MSIVEKTYLSEILLRFSSGEPHQLAKLGDLEGIHAIERVRLVDSDTGAIVGTPAGKEADNVRPLKIEDVQPYLGDHIAAIVDGVDAIKAALAVAQADLQAKDSQIATLTGERDRGLQQISALTAERDQAMTKLSAAQQALA